MERISELEQLSGAALNNVKVLLADEATTMLHGPDCVAAIHATAGALFSANGGALDESSLDSLRTVQLAEGEMGPGRGLRVLDLLLRAELVPSKKEARRLVRNGGVRINDAKVEDEMAEVTAADFGTSGRLKLSAGKKSHVVVALPQPL